MPRTSVLALTPPSAVMGSAPAIPSHSTGAKVVPHELPPNDDPPDDDPLSSSDPSEGEVVLVVGCTVGTTHVPCPSRKPDGHTGVMYKHVLSPVSQIPCTLLSMHSAFVMQV
jgi:hypothetical protein